MYIDGEDIRGVIIILVVTIGIFYAGYIVGVHNADKEAISAGVAKWMFNVETGEKSFIYITREEEKKQ